MGKARIALAIRRETLTPPSDAQFSLDWVKPASVRGQSVQRPDFTHRRLNVACHGTLWQSYLVSSTANFQAYEPFRASLLRPDEIRALHILRPWVPVRDTLFHWMCIIAAWALVSFFPNVWIVLAAVVVVGINLHGLFIIGHDGLHRRLFLSTRLNDLWNDFLIIGGFGAVTRMNRVNHMTHHRITCLKDDPDRHKYIHDGKEPLVPFL